ncbi:hypothetical protein [Desulfocurvus sp. DL9XJH121]
MNSKTECVNERGSWMTNGEEPMDRKTLEKQAEEIRERIKRSKTLLSKTSFRNGGEPRKQVS